MKKRRSKRYCLNLHVSVIFFLYRNVIYEKYWSNIMLMFVVTNDKLYFFKG